MDIFDAVRLNKKDLVEQYLIDKGDPNVISDIGIPLIILSILYNKDEEILKLLYNHGADVNIKESSTNYTCGHCVIDNKNLKKLRFLLKNGLKVNAIDSSGNTMLHNLFLNDDSYQDDYDKFWKITNLLLENKIDLNITNFNGDKAENYLSLENIETFEELRKVY